MYNHMNSINTYMYMYIWMVGVSLCLSVCLSVCLSICLSVMYYSWLLRLAPNDARHLTSINTDTCISHSWYVHVHLTSPLLAYWLLSLLPCCFVDISSISLASASWPGSEGSASSITSGMLCRQQQPCQCHHRIVCTPPKQPMYMDIVYLYHVH